ncbi:urease accessory protein UreF [Terasakiella sp. A23]|uniref:urease accessory protein UreF n=1 Tax=Terasakiella sp. FCG-A23 TaxID=3080561 RepID=UPI002952C7AE|nr:urease accessory protein UreF [Terasakiella sp. A23]MDV7339585.1 urease accessory protein UreF [Terasakiella sp. A23]
MLTTNGLLRLMTYLSPSFPVGAYTYSHGVEFAIEDGLVTSGETLQNWTEGALLFGAGHTDGMFFCRAWELADQGDLDGLAELNSYANAMRPTSEMTLEGEAQGRAFLTILLDVMPSPELEQFASLLKEQDQLAAYPVIVGAVAAFQDIDCQPALVAYLHAFAANLISAGVRLVPLGQTAGQKALMGLEGAVEEAATSALKTDFKDIGSSAPVIDWTSMQHETQYTRLFRS